MDFGVVFRNAPFILGGLALTFQLAFLATAGGLLLGTLLGAARLSRRPWLSIPAGAYVHFFRGLPLILVIFWLYFLVPVISGKTLDEFSAAAVSFIVYEASYFAEIVRAGIQAVGSTGAGDCPQGGTTRPLLPGAASRSPAGRLTARMALADSSPPRSRNPARLARR